MTNVCSTVILLLKKTNVKKLCPISHCQPVVFTTLTKSGDLGLVLQPIKTFNHGT